MGYKEIIKKYGPLVALAIVLFALAMNWGAIVRYAGVLITVFRPLILGFGIAFVLNIILRAYEEKLLAPLFSKYPRLKKTKRAIGIVLTYVTVILVIAGIICFLVPQVASSFDVLVQNMPGYAQKVQEVANEWITRLNIDQMLINEFTANWKEILSKAGDFLSTTVFQIFNITVGVTTGIMSFVMGLIFSVYMLATKEKLIGSLKRLLRAFTSDWIYTQIDRIGKEANRLFSLFIGGQLIEAVILGTLCFIGMSLLRIPYAPLISVLVGITSLIPILGAWLGVVPSALILLMENPLQALIFVLFILILQQIEGNLIYPRVVGNAIGLGGFWVLLAITVGGGLFGLTGMLISVPLMALLYTLLREIVYNRLDRRKH